MSMQLEPFSTFVEKRKKEKRKNNLACLATESSRHMTGDERTMFEQFDLSETDGLIQVDAVSHDGKLISEKLDLDCIIDLLTVLKRMGADTANAVLDTEPVEKEVFLTTDDKAFIARLERLRDSTGDELLTDLIEIYSKESDLEKRGETRKNAEKYIDDIENLISGGSRYMAELKIRRFVKWIGKVKDLANQGLAYDSVGALVSGYTGLTPEQTEQIKLLLQLDGANDKADTAIHNMIDLVKNPDADPEEAEKLNKITAMVDFYNNADGSIEKQTFAVSTLKTIFGLEVSIMKPIEVGTGTGTDSVDDNESDSVDDSDPLDTPVVECAAGSFTDFIVEQNVSFLQEESTAGAFEFFDIKQLRDNEFEIYAITKNGSEITLLVSAFDLMSNSFQSNLRRMAIN